MTGGQLDLETACERARRGARRARRQVVIDLGASALLLALTILFWLMGRGLFVTAWFGLLSIVWAVLAWVDSRTAQMLDITVGVYQRLTGGEDDV